MKKNIIHNTNEKVFKIKKIYDYKMSDMTTLQLLIMNLAISQIDYTLKLKTYTKEDRIITFYKKDILKKLNLQRLPKNFEAEIDELMNIKIKHKEIDEPESFIKMTIFPICSYNEKEEKLKMEINDAIMDYFIDIDKKFMWYYFSNISKFRSKYSIYFYELIRNDMFQIDLKEKDELKYSVETIKSILHIEPTLRWQDVKKIISRSISEINKKSDVEFDYDYDKNTKSIENIKIKPLNDNKYIEKNLNEKQKIELIEENKEETTLSSDVDLSKLSPSELMEYALNQQKLAAELQSANDKKDKELSSQHQQTRKFKNKFENLEGKYSSGANEYGDDDENGVKQQREDRDILMEKSILN